MLDLITQVPGWMELVILLAAFIGAVIAIKKTVYNPIKQFNAKVNAGMDTLLGYPAVHDPGSGRQLKAATPALALRVETLEDAMHKLIDNQERLLSVTERLQSLEEWRINHIQWSEEMVKEVHEASQQWQKEHEAMHLLSHETAKEINKQ